MQPTLNNTAYIHPPQQPQQPPQQAAGMPSPQQSTGAMCQPVMQCSEPTGAAFKMAPANNLDSMNFQHFYSPAAPIGHEQRQQHLGQSPEVPSTAFTAGPGATAGLVPSSHSSPQLSGLGGATDDSQQSAGAADHMGSNPDWSEPPELGASKPTLPVVHLKVACGDMIGTLLVHKGKIVMYEGTTDEKEVSPTEFERLGGRSATKKWKQSIRLINEDGERVSAGMVALCRQSLRL